MTNQLQFELVSPEKLLLSKAFDMVVIPAKEGDMGILYGHTPLVTSLRPGLIVTFLDNKPQDYIYVDSGFVEVNRERCILLAEEAENIKDISTPQLEQHIKDAQEDVADAKTEAEKTEAQDRLTKLQTKLKVINETSYV